MYLTQPSRNDTRKDDRQVHASAKERGKKVRKQEVVKSMNSFTRHPQTIKLTEGVGFCRQTFCSLIRLGAG